MIMMMMLMIVVTDTQMRIFLMGILKTNCNRADCYSA